MVSAVACFHAGKVKDIKGSDAGKYISRERHYWSGQTIHYRSDNALIFAIFVYFVDLLSPATVILREVQQEGVDGDGQTVLHHVPDNTGQQTPRKLQTRIGVYLDEPDLPLGVEQEVVAEDLEGEDVPVSFQLIFGGQDADTGQVLHLL